MSFGFTIAIGENEFVDPDDDDVIAFAVAPQFTDQIEPLAGGDAPFLEDRGNVLVTVNAVCSRTHDSLAEAAAYLLGLAAATVRKGDVTITIDPTGSAPAAYEIEGALVRCQPGAFTGATTNVSWTIIGPAPEVIEEEPEP